VVVIQERPLTKSAILSVPAEGSAVYMQEGDGLVRLDTPGPPSALQLELTAQPGETRYWLDYPQDRTRYGGVLFLWDKDGNPRTL
jgi:hypothetical protein